MWAGKPPHNSIEPLIGARRVAPLVPLTLDNFDTHGLGTLTLFLFRSPRLMATGRSLDLPYSVEQWDDQDSRVEELIALTADYRVARAAFDEAVKCRPGRVVTLRQKSRLLADSRSRPRD